MRLCLPVLALAAVFAPALSAQQTLHLVPVPREVRPDAAIPLTGGLRITCQQPCAQEDSFAIADLTQTLADRGIAVTDSPSAPHILVTRFSSPIGQQTYREATPGAAAGRLQMDPAMEPEGYVVLPDRNGDAVAGLAVTADTSAGVFYALQTVKQLIVGNGSGAVLHTATIRDWPAMKYRGLHDDLSRGPIDTLDFQKKLIRTLAAYKVNIYSPYYESTQAYPSNPLAAIPGGSITPAEARELVAYASQYHITVVPEQEAFGHLSHVLTFDRFAAAAETPHGAVLAPGQPESMQLIDSMFKDLAQMYPGPFLHVGADETFELGMGRTRADVDARGLPAVYLDYMQKIVSDLQPLHRKILFWGDIAQSAPDLLKAMPQSFKDQTIVVAWGYSPNPRGFANYLKPYADAGFQLWIAPSINNYRQIYPNQREALEDIQEFTRDGQKFGATGQLNTLWDDDGESLANMNWYGILFGAACAWQPGESSIDAFQQSYGQVFHGDLTGLVDHAQGELTAAMALLRDNHVVSGTEGTDGLFWVDPWSKDGQVFAARMRPIATQLRLHVEQAIVDLDTVRTKYPAAPSAAAARMTFASGSPAIDLSPWAAQQYPATSLQNPEALDAMDFAARRLDFLGLLFQLSDEMSVDYAQAQATLAAGNWRKAKPGVAALLGDMNGVNGRLEDLTWGYSNLRQMFQQQWLRTYRPANLQPVLERYDFTVHRWLDRIDKVRSAQRQWTESHTLPPASDLGIAPPPAPVGPSPNEVEPPRR